VTQKQANVTVTFPIPNRTAPLAALVACTLAAAPAPAIGPELDPDDRSALLHADRVMLRSAVEEVLRRPQVAGARIGVHVVDVATGETVYAHEADELLNPASNVKLVTAAAALARLGPEYRFATEFSCSEPATKGNCGVLFVKGRGDPLLYTERLYQVAGELFHRGIRRVTDIVVDDTYFDEVRDGPGWEQESGDRPYLAPAGALSINHNAIEVYVGPGDAEKQRARVEVEPASEFFRIENAAVTVGRRNRQGIGVRAVADGPYTKLIIRGRIPVGRETTLLARRVTNPPLYAGETIKELLKSRGVQVKGKVRTGTVPADARLVHTTWSPPLSEILRALNKHSNNFIAEQLLKTLGAEVMGPPGTWAKGVAAVEQFLVGVGVPRGAYIMRNGSGLNDTNRFSAAQFTHLLVSAHQRALWYPEFASSLCIAARDGTIRTRLEGTLAAGRLRGKTGTLENTSALSGYVQLPSGGMYAYAIIVNDFPAKRRDAVAAIDDLAATIASGGPPPRPPPAPPPDGEELRARLATYANLMKQGDARNLPFLRSALRAEQDPILRATLAEALYRADRESNAQVLVDNVPTAADVYGRMRALAAELTLPVPLVPSLLDLSAEGHPEALDRVLQLAVFASGDRSLEPLLTEGLQDAGRASPEALADAMKRANEATQLVVVDLLAKGIVASTEEGEHPVPVLLAAESATVPAAAKLSEKLAATLTALRTPPAPAEPAAVPADAVATPAVSPPPNDRPGGG